MSVLVLRLPAAPDGPAAWLRTDGEGAPDMIGRAEPPFDGALAGLEADRVVLLVPGELVVGHSLHLPGADAQARAAAPFAVEDEWASDAAALHFALGPAPAPGLRGAGAASAAGPGAPRPVAVIARDAMDGILAAAASLGAAPDAAVPEWAAVPAGPGECAALVERGVAHVNFGGAWGFTADADLAALLIGRGFGRFETGRVAVWGDPAAIAPPEGWGGRELTAHPALDSRDALAVFARGAASAQLNLLQGAYAPRRKRTFDFTPWRRAAILAAALFAAWLGLTVAETAALNRRTAALEAEARAAFAAAFPDETRIVNPRLQMQARLAQLRGSGGAAFLDLAALLGAAVAAREGVEIDALRYDRADGALGAELAMTDYAEVQALRDLVAQAGGTLEEGASRQADGRIAADVTVRLR